MHKSLLCGLSVIMLATSANAGLLDFLGLKKSAEPTTLAEACNKDEISKFCPEILTGDQTIPTCLTENVKSLSKKCSKFIKKSVQDQVNEAKNAVEAVKSGANDTANEKVAEVVQKKNAAVDTAKEIKAAAKQVESDARETGSMIKGMFKKDAE